MSKRDKRWLFGGIALFIFLALGFINFFIYPFQAQNPNFSDVEEVFSRLEFPEDWKEIDSSENRGNFGRTCPIEGSGCFSKTTTFSVSNQTSNKQVEEVMLMSGCPLVSIEENEVIGGDPYTTLRCSTFEEVDVSSTVFKEATGWRLYLIVSTY